MYIRAAKNLYKSFTSLTVAFVLACNSLVAVTPLFTQTAHAEEATPQTEQPPVSDTPEQTTSEQPTNDPQTTSQPTPQLQSQNLTPQILPLSTPAGPTTPTNGTPNGEVKRPSLFWIYDWSSSSGPGVITYEFRASQDPTLDADGKLVNATITKISVDSAETGLSILTEGVWYWQVRAQSTVLFGPTTYSNWSQVWTVIIDTTNPVVTITSPLDGTTVKGLVPLSATVTDQNPGKTTFEVFKGTSFNPANRVFVGEAYGTAPSVSWDASTADGTYRLRVKSEDQAGNESNTATSTFTVDNVAPQVAITNPATDGTNQTGSFTISVQASDNRDLKNLEVIVRSDTDPTTSVTCYSSPVSGTAVVRSCTLDTNTLPEGSYTIYATATDKADSETTTQRQFFIDRNNPTAHITNPVDGAAFGGTTTTIALEGIVDDANIATYQFVVRNADNDIVFDSTAKSTLSGPVSEHWDITSITSGTYTIILTATDKLSQSTQDSISIVIDKDAPIVIILPQNMKFIGTSVKPTVLVNDANGPFTYLWEANDKSYETIISNPTIQEPVFTPTVAGTYTFYLTVTDSLGNATTPPIAFTFDWEPFIATNPDTTGRGSDTGSNTGGATTTVFNLPIGLQTTPFNTTSPNVLGVTTYQDQNGQNTSTPSDGKTKSSSTVATDEDKQKKEVTTPTKNSFAWYWILLLVILLIAIYYAYRNWKLRQENQTNN